MAAYCRVYDARHLQADCQEPGSAPEPYALYRVWATLKRAAISFAVWWTEARWVWTVCLRLLLDSVVLLRNSDSTVGNRVWATFTYITRQMGACEWQVVAERRPGGPVGRTPRRIHHRPAGWICPELSLNSRCRRSRRHRVPPHELLHVRHRCVCQPHWERKCAESYTKWQRLCLWSHWVTSVHQIPRLRPSPNPANLSLFYSLICTK